MDNRKLLILGYFVNYSYKHNYEKWKSSLFILSCDCLMTKMCISCVVLRNEVFIIEGAISLIAIYTYCVELHNLLSKFPFLFYTDITTNLCHKCDIQEYLPRSTVCL